MLLYDVVRQMTNLKSFSSITSSFFPLLSTSVVIILLSALTPPHNTQKNVSIQ